MRPLTGIALFSLVVGCGANDKVLLEDLGQGTISLEFSSGITATGSGRGTMLLEVTEDASIDGCTASAELGGNAAGVVWSGGLVLPRWEEGSRSIMVSAMLDFNQTDPGASGAEAKDHWSGTVELVHLDDTVLELSLLEGELCLADAASCEMMTGS